MMKGITAGESRMSTLFLGLVLMVCMASRVTNGQASGTLGFVLNGVSHPNGSTVLNTDIGEGAAALQCTTDSTTCCTNQNGETRAGEFYFPEGIDVPREGNSPTNQVPRAGDSATSPYYRERHSRSISLNRRSDIPAQPTGQFRCEIPDASGTTVNLFINIVEPPPTTTAPPITTTESITTTPPMTTTQASVTTQLPTTTEPFTTTFTTSSAATTQAVPTTQSDVMISIPQITASGINAVGRTYTLVCSATVTGSTSDQPTFTWLHNGGEITSDTTRMVSTTVDSGDGSYSSTLTFSPLAISHAGTYTCEVKVGGVTETQTNTVIVIRVYLSLKGVVYPNNSVILITEIEQTSDTSNKGLQCITDKRPCCAALSNRFGEWLFPSGDNVPGTAKNPTTFYRNRGDDGTVNLNRLNSSIMMPTGRFCCVVPDDTSTDVTLCVQIVLTLPTTLPPITTLPPPMPTTAVTKLTDSTPSSSDPMDTSPSGSPGGQQDTGPGTGLIAGVIVVVIILIAAAVVIVIVVVFVLRRRGSDKFDTRAPLKPRPTPPVAYAKTHNGEKVSVVEKKLDARIMKFPSDTNITEGEGVYFKIKVSGVPQPTVTWYHDGEPVKGDYAREIEEDGSLAIPSTELKHSGVYKAVVANQHGLEEREVRLTVAEEGVTTIAAVGDVVSSRPIPIPEFGKHVAELHANSNQPFRDLFQALDSGEAGHTTTYAIDPDRKLLNRFGNIVVYDDNRISLQPIEDYKEDYVNASYVNGYSLPTKFIATQGPLPKTVVDFWRLIWQERPPTIVMVTNVKEGNRIKCQQYWPDSGKKEFGPFQVIITDQQVFADYTVRTLSVSLGSGRSHKVTQYHFTAWPDHGVPDYATPILAFHRRVKAQHHPSRGPMVVHCSAGVGRTGTFIVIDNILEQIEKEQVVDIPGAITKIRQRRMKMVQTHEQLAFIYDAILESVTCGDTQISATNLRVAITKMKKKNPVNQLNTFQHQFQILEQVSPKPSEVQCSQAQCFPERSRGNLFLPANRWRVILKGEHPDFIHAVNINGYKQQKAFIIAQGPMDSTARNFWKMIYDRKCAVVVMVSGLVEGGVEASTRYWPSSGTYQYGEYTVDLLGEEPLEGFTIRDLSVIDSQSEKAHKVTQFHITCWTADGRCSNLKSITDVIEEMTKVQIRSGNKPIVVHCNDTVTRSGMFCAITTTIERCKTEGVVDVFQVVKALRVQKPGAVPTVEQYKLIFDSVLVFLESFDTYANFQNI